MLSNITFDRTTNLFNYYLENQIIIFDNFTDLYWLKDAINKEKIIWKIDTNTNLLYCVDDDKKIYLIEKILSKSIDDLDVIFVDKNHFNYSSSNIKIIKKNKNIKPIYENLLNGQINNLENNFPDNFPTNYHVIEKFDGHKVNAGKKSGYVFNPYWSVYDKNDDMKKKIILMSCNENKNYFIFSYKSIDYVKNKTWFLSENGYITTVEKNDGKRFQYYLHQLICKTEKGDESETKTVDHINRNKLDNRIENLRWATQSEQNANTDKRARKYNAKPLPEGIEHKDLPKYVVYYHEWLNKDKTSSREFFKIEKHPKLEKIWIGSKSNKITILDKLKQAKDKLIEIEV